MTSPLHAPARPRTVPFVAALASHGDALAVATSAGTLTYRELSGRVEAFAGRLGSTRRLVLLAATNDVDSLVAYLGALAGGHAVLLVPADNAAALDGLVAAYDPDVVVRPVAGSGRLEERRIGTAHELHPDLALLLSTSGSTGSPKLVRLSHRNVAANAESIADYLGIRPTDRAATTLPMHYCYGLSVINSHLLRGAGLVLTGLSVVDACFWDLFRTHRATTFAAVPYTFDLLDRAGFADLDLPHLRYVTQAGGRLAPEQVRRYARLGRRAGWDLVVMYGQTEATARMAYLPPALAATHPEAIGVPIPGGSFTLEPLPDHPEPGTGELVYSGPNVMLGYAETPADLALGRTVDVLRTGDVARRSPDGLYEVVGRRGRFVKVFGLRIDLQHVEAVLAAHGVSACCAATDGRLVVAVPEERDAGLVLRVAARELGLPEHVVRVCAVPELPRTASGKPDYRALAEQPALAGPAADAGAPAPGPRTAGPEALRALYADLLGRGDVTEDSTFVGLGGDSLSYVEMSVRLEQLLGHLPPHWHSTPIRDLAATAPRRRRLLGRTVETSVLLRAVAIVAIVGTHADLFTLLGSAHVLLAVAGFNFARFHLTPAGPADRVRHQLASIARIAVPSMVWIAGALVLTGQYGLANVFLLNALTGPETWSPLRHFWFVEVLVYLLVALTALLAVPWVDRAERRRPFLFAVAVLGVGLLGRYELLGPDLLNTLPVLWLFALGWATARADSAWARVLVTVAAVATVPGFFDDPRREALIVAGIALLAWAPGIRCPAALGRVAGVLASSSLYIYLTHWQVYPRFADQHALVAVLASIGVGVAYWLFVAAVVRWWRGTRGAGVPGAAPGRDRGGARRQPATAGTPTPSGGA